MTDRIEEKRHQNAIQVRDNLKKKFDQARKAKTFAESLIKAESLIRGRRLSVPQKSQPKTDIKPQVKAKDQRENPPKAKKPERQKIALPRTKKDSDQFLQFAAQFAAQKERPTQDVQTAAQPMLPSPVINELIERIYTCSTSGGQKTVSIRLKSNVLAGAQIDVSVSEREVRLHFQDTNSETRQLLRHSKHQLESRLAEKKLSLRDFAFH